MSKVRVEELPLHTEAVLCAQVATRDSLATWQRVGTLRVTESGPVVAWDPDTGYLESVWRPAARVASAREGAGKTVRFAVFAGRRCVVVAERFVSAEELVRLRQQLRAGEGRASKGLGVGPRGYRSGWPRF